MFAFGEKHPIWFEIILIVLAFLAAALLTAAGNLFSADSDLSTSFGRILVGAALLVVYRRAFRGGRPFYNLVIVLPALLFAVWNLYYNLSSGMVPGGPEVIIMAVITAAAPAVFEEVLFRGIFLYNLKKNGKGDLPCLFLSAAVFSAVHLTNAVGMDIASVALQVVYSFVIGLVLAAVYLRNNCILQVMAVHFLIDFTNGIFAEQASTASTVQIVIFCVLLAAEAAYAVILTAAGKSDCKEDPE